MARSIPGAPRFFYGWSIVAIAFVTMGVGVNARTAFSLFFPPILDEFGWPRGLTAGAFSFGFLVSAILGPILGRMMDRRGPRAVMLLGVALAPLNLLARRRPEDMGLLPDGDPAPAATIPAGAHAANVVDHA